MAEDPFHDMETFDLNLSELTSQSFRDLMQEKRNYSLQLAAHTFRGVPITTLVGTYHRIRLHQGEIDPLYLIFRDIDHYFVGFHRGTQAFHFIDTTIPNPPGVEVFQLATKATHGALSQGGKAPTVGGTVIIQGYYDLLTYHPGDVLTDAIMKALYRNALMFSEAERFRSAQNHVCHMIDNYICECMPESTSDRFTQWGSLSKVGLAARQREVDQNQVPDENVPEVATRLNINTMGQLVGEPDGELLLLLYCPGYGI